MAIVRSGSGRGELDRRVGVKAAKKAAKKGAKHSAKKHAAKKGVKHAAKKTHSIEAEERRRQREESHDEALDREDQELEHAFHHLHRAAAVISLLEKETGGDLRQLLEHGIELYRNAAGSKRRKGSAQCAAGLLRAAEHLSLAGLYEARSGYRVEVPPPSRREVERQLREVGPRLDELGSPERENARRLCSMARELLHRAERAGHDPHLEYELVMAAEGICVALEEGL